MNEQDALQWVSERFDPAAIEKLELFRRLLLTESANQNLISPATYDAVWGRHIVDSAQLISVARTDIRHWLDIGTGAGFPGLVIAVLLPDTELTLVEPRGRRAEFLRTSAENLALTNVDIRQCRARQIEDRTFDIISARAVAALPDLLEMTSHLRSARTQYLLPKGRSGAAELETLPTKWQGLFHVEQSITDPQSVILVGTGVS